MTKKKCFVISPIGEKDTETRKNADDLLEFILEPALERYDFEVIRADRIAKPTEITDDILALVREAELCIVDLTENNPNVFYECGRRHEQGKPCIQLVRRGEAIPFDVAGIRTIEYDLSSLRTATDTISTIREFIDSYEQAEYISKGSGASLATIATGIERLERQIARLHGIPRSRAESSAGEEEFDQVLATIISPHDAIRKFLSSGDVDGAAAFLEKNRDRMSTNWTISSSSLVAMAGSPIGLEILLDEFTRLLDGDFDFSYEQLVFGLGGAVQYYGNLDIEKEGSEKLAPIFSRALERFDGQPNYLAFIYNQMAKLHSGARDFETAIVYAQKAVELNPTEDAYRNNLEVTRRGLEG